MNPQQQGYNQELDLSQAHGLSTGPIYKQGTTWTRIPRASTEFNRKLDLYIIVSILSVADEGGKHTERSSSRTITHVELCIMETATMLATAPFATGDI